MKLIFHAIFAIAILGPSFAAESKIEAIKFLVADLSKYPPWTEGHFISLSIPADATFNTLTSAYLKKSQFKWGTIKYYNIEETEDCAIPPKSKQIYKRGLCS